MTSLAERRTSETRIRPSDYNRERFSMQNRLTTIFFSAVIAVLALLRSDTLAEDTFRSIRNCASE